ncbi:MAG: alginate export family protein [Nitrospirota bacterium]
MKKFLVAAIVVAMVCVSSAAFAVDVTMGGQIDIRFRDFQNSGYGGGLGTLFDKSRDGSHRRLTQERVQLFVNVKGDGFKGKVAIKNEWDDFGRFEANQGNYTSQSGSSNQIGGNSTDQQNTGLAIREAWVDFLIPGTPVGMKLGHQFLSLSNGWFLMSTYDGSDALVAYVNAGPATITLFDIMAFEGNRGNAGTDINIYGLDATVKATDKIKVGANLSYLNDRGGLIIAGRSGLIDTAKVTQLAGTSLVTGTASQFKLANLGLYMNGKIGAVNLKVEADIQDGKAQTTNGDVNFDGNLVVVQASVPVGPVTINALVGRGSGDNAGSGSRNNTFITLLEQSQFTALIYDYKLQGPTKQLYTGLAGTTALNIGVASQVSKSILVKADLWYFQATRATNVNNGPGKSKELGQELDLYGKWQIYPNLSWDIKLGYMMPGNAYKTAAGKGVSDATGLQSVLSFKF